MTRKKTLAKDAVLLNALRINLNLLGEIAMRYEVETQPERPEDPPSINSPKDVHDLLGPEMSKLAQEQLRVLLLNIKNNVVGQRVIYQGNVNSSMIRPAEVLRPAVIEAVPSIIVSHNHPSADPTPSPEDVACTGSCPRRPSCWASTCWTTSSSAGTVSSASRSGASWPPDRAGTGPARPLTRGTPPRIDSTLTTKGDSPCSQPTSSTPKTCSR